MKRLVYLAMAALVAMLILVPTAMAQETTGPDMMKMEEKDKDLPKSGGMEVSSVLLPAGALLLGSGVLAFVVLRRR